MMAAVKSYLDKMQDQGGKESVFTQIHPGKYWDKDTGDKKYKPCMRALHFRTDYLKVIYHSAPLSKIQTKHLKN